MHELSCRRSPQWGYHIESLRTHHTYSLTCYAHITFAHRHLVKPQYTTHSCILHYIRSEKSYRCSTGIALTDWISDVYRCIAGLAPCAFDNRLFVIFHPLVLVDTRGLRNRGWPRCVSFFIATLEPTCASQSHVCAAACKPDRVRRDVTSNQANITDNQ